MINTILFEIKVSEKKIKNEEKVANVMEFNKNENIFGLWRQKKSIKGDKRKC